MCCGKGAGCDGVPIPVGISRPDRFYSPDPAGLSIEAVPVSAAAGRGDTGAIETRAAVAVQTQEVPWMFARTRRPEGFGAAEDNDGTKGPVPRLYRHDLGSLDDMAPWAETHPTVLRQRPTMDDGLAGSACR